MPALRPSPRLGACSAVVLAGLLTSTSLAEAQGRVCRPLPGSNEARLLTHFVVPLAFSSALPLPQFTPGQVAVALETSWLPTPDASVRRSEQCYLDKAENTGLSPVLPRPRVAVGLVGGVAVEASVLPPVTVADATPLLVGLALSYARPLGDRAMLLVRGHTTLGHVDGPVTCARDALQSDPGLPCYGDTPSNDRYAPNVTGGELLIALPRHGAWQAHLGAGVLHARPRFNVNFTNAFGVRDETQLLLTRTAASVTAGLSRRIGPRAAVGLLGYAVPDGGTTLRFTGQWQLR
jgi:hypothetical protein